MPEAAVVRLGALRLATLPLEGPAWAVEATCARVRDAVVSGGGQAYGPDQVWVPHRVESEDPLTWQAQAAVALTGLPRLEQPIGLEDYQGLQALQVEHEGPWRGLQTTYRRLADQAQTMGWRLRPYWRIILQRRRTADGMPWPTCAVAIFADR
jgi:hypothetical protein